MTSLTCQLRWVFSSKRDSTSHNSVRFYRTTRRSTDRADGGARARISAWLAEHGRLAGLVLTTPGAVAWATGGVAPPGGPDRGHRPGLGGRSPARSPGLITTEVEADRVRDEYGPASPRLRRPGRGALVRPGRVRRGRRWIWPVAGAARLAADGHPAFGTDAADDLTALRLALSGPEQADLRDSAPTPPHALRAGARRLDAGRARPRHPGAVRGRASRRPGPTRRC